MHPEREILKRAAEQATERLLAENSEQALQAGVELMLLSHSTSEVIRRLRHWADYLEERR